MSIVESKFDTYTSEDLIAYGHRLHINTAICLMVNTLAIYCILFHSTKGMGVYKWYLLAIQLTTALFDFHLNVISAPFPTFPIPGFCAAGIWSRHWGYYYGHVVQYWLTHWFLSFQGMAILWGILYRYRVISEKMTYMESKWAIAVMFILPVIYPIPSVFVSFLGMPDENTSLAYVSQEAPEMLHLYLAEPCLSAVSSPIVFAYYFTAASQMALGYSIILFYSYKTYDDLMKKKLILSDASFKMQKQLLVSLCLQCIVPFMMLMIPCVGLFMMVFFNVKKMKVMSMIALQIITVHSSANGLVLIWTIKPYREAVIKLFCGRWVKQKVQPTRRNTMATSHISVIEGPRRLTRV